MMIRHTNRRRCTNEHWHRQGAREATNRAQRTQHAHARVSRTMNRCCESPSPRAHATTESIARTATQNTPQSGAADTCDRPGTRDRCEAAAHCKSFRPSVRLPTAAARPPPPVSLPLGRCHCCAATSILCSTLPPLSPRHSSASRAGGGRLSFARAGVMPAASMPAASVPSMPSPCRRTAHAHHQQPSGQPSTVSGKEGRIRGRRWLSSKQRRTTLSGFPSSAHASIEVALPWDAGGFEPPRNLSQIRRRGLAA